MSNVWAITMVRDELDILPYTIAHLANQGLTGIIIADNRSTDGTTEWLRNARDRQTYACEIVVLHDSEIGYYQSRKMTRLAREAGRRGAQWILPFDADEFWFNPRGPTLADTLEGNTPYGCLQAPLHNYFPTSQDDPTQANPFRRIRHRDPTPAPLPKVLIQARDDIVIAQGNHAAEAPNLQVGRTVIEVGHFPWRSPQQFETKVRNGYQAYQATDLSDDVGAHWRQYGQLLHTHGPAALREVYDTWFHDPPGRIEPCPVPWN